MWTKTEFNIETWMKNDDNRTEQKKQKQNKIAQSHSIAKKKKLKKNICKIVQFGSH